MLRKIATINLICINFSKRAKNTFWDWKSTSKSRIIRSIKGSREDEEKSQYGQKIFFFKKNDKGHIEKWWITIKWYSIRATKQFRKSLKHVERRGYNIDLLDEVVDMLSICYQKEKNYLKRTKTINFKGNLLTVESAISLQTGY